MVENEFVSFLRLGKTSDSIIGIRYGRKESYSAKIVYIFARMTGVRQKYPVAIIITINQTFPIIKTHF